MPAWRSREDHKKCSVSDTPTEGTVVAHAASLAACREAPQTTNEWMKEWRDPTVQSEGSSEVLSATSGRPPPQSARRPFQHCGKWQSFWRKLDNR
mmetsp:Transcript_20170/g.28046  ORF Transcript_20170/g.28046 Transcript_20170/m.28046 type:complete len:95 (+) Transcript_20170:78-362(+)